jgi:hypothetical protein
LNVTISAGPARSAVPTATPVAADAVVPVASTVIVSRCTISEIWVSAAPSPE